MTLPTKVFDRFVSEARDAIHESSTWEPPAPFDLKEFATSFVDDDDFFGFLEDREDCAPYIAELVERFEKLT